MRPPRFRIRTLMIAVAVVGLLLAGAVVRSRVRAQRERFAALVRQHDTQDMSAKFVESLVAEQIETIAVLRKFRNLDPNGSDEFSDNVARARAEIDRNRRIAEYRATMSAKYEQAARRPWLPVPPDPPASE